MATRTRSRQRPHRPLLPLLRKGVPKFTGKTYPAPPSSPRLLAQDEILDVQGLAQYIHVPESWVRQECARGARSGLPRIKVGAKFVRFKKSSVDRWLAQQERTA